MPPASPAGVGFAGADARLARREGSEPPTPFPWSRPSCSSCLHLGPGEGSAGRRPRSFSAHVMVMATSNFVPRPGPAGDPARRGLPALALLLAAGLLHTQVSKQGWEVWEKCIGLSCEGAGETPPEFALLPDPSPYSSCCSLLLQQPVSRHNVPACIPSSFPALAAPTPAAPVPANATSSAAGCLISGEAQLLLSQDSLVPTSGEGSSVSESIGGGVWARGGSAALQPCPFPAGLPFGTLLPAGLRTQLLPQGRCPFPLHLGQHPLRPRPAPCLEGPAAQDVHERAQHCAGVSHGHSPDSAQPTATTGFLGSEGTETRVFV